MGCAFWAGGMKLCMGVARKASQNAKNAREFALITTRCYTLCDAANTKEGDSYAFVD